MQSDAIPAVLAHELRNPLAGVVVHLELLREMMDPDDPRMESIEAMDKDLGRMEGTISSILEFTRYGTLNIKQADAGNLMTTICSRLRNEVERKGLAFRFQSAPDIGMIKADTILLERVVANLVDNAAKASMGMGGLVCVSVKNEGTEVVIKVTDNGVGMEADLLDRIFEPFFTRSNHGIGLGLALAKRIINDHGGGIEASSKSSEGSEFTIRIPMDTSNSCVSKEVAHGAASPS